MLFRFLIPLTLLLSLSLQAQSVPTLLWQVTEPAGTIGLRPPSIGRDKDGHIWMLTNQIDATPFGGITLVKYDSTGQMLWNVNDPLSIFGRFYGAYTLDPAGNAYIGHCIDGSIPEFDGDSDLLKYDSNGNLVWSKTSGPDLGGDSYIILSELDSLHDVLITVSFNRNESDSTENIIRIQAVDPPSGDPIWTTDLPGIYVPYQLKIFDDSMTVLAAQIENQVAYYVILQLDFNGQILAQPRKSFTGVNLEYSMISKTGDVILGTNTLEFAVTRINPAGDTLWRYGTPDINPDIYNWARAMTEDTDMNVYATGGVSIPGQGLVWQTIKISPSGEVLWSQRFNVAAGNFQDAGEKAILDSNLLLVAGTIQFNNNDLTGAVIAYDTQTGEEVFKIVLGADNLYRIGQILVYQKHLYYTGIGYDPTSPPLQQSLAITGCIRLPAFTSSTTSLPVPGIQIGPNPASDFLRITSIDPKIFEEVIVQDMQGREWARQPLNSSEAYIQTGGLPAGAYVVRLSGKGYLFSKKWIKSGN